MGEGGWLCVKAGTDNVMMWVSVCRSGKQLNKSLHQSMLSVISISLNDPNGTVSCITTVHFHVTYLTQIDVNEYLAMGTESLKDFDSMLV